MPIGVMLRLVCGRFAAVETWYSRSSGTVGDTLNQGRALASARSRCMSSNVYIEGIRVFNTDVKYDVRNVSFAQPIALGELGISGALPDNPSNLADIQSTSLMVKVTGAVGGRNRTGNRELFGVPDNVVVTSEQGQRVYAPTAAFKTGFNVYALEITTGWNFRCLAITPRHTIQALVVDSAPPGLLGLQANLAGDGLIAPGKRVRIRGAVRRTTMTTLNGLWTVSRVDAPVAPSTLSTVYLIGSSNISTTGYDPLGTVEGIDHVYCPATDYIVNRPIGRKRGGRSGLSRGRSLARSR